MPLSAYMINQHTDTDDVIVLACQYLALWGLALFLVSSTGRAPGAFTVKGLN